jgi:hypothetical protein
MERPRKPGTFLPGDPRAGRPKGKPNKTTREIRQLAQELLTNRDYLESLKERLQTGTAGRIEELLYFYAWGKPKEEIILPQDQEAEENVITIDVRQNGHRAV